jgi:CheY-like chemotaxis protein
LFADDSVTAQNMGRKILTEAGYDVVAVSNGAAAVKKIAEQKPDIIILDVYMPGYSGLEVCEKVRGSMETLKTPVLLTVGKMEPFKPEDGNRVKADGVIVKPFEASDLLAIMKKFEERIGQTPVLVPQPVLVERYQEEINERPVEHTTSSTAPQPTVEVPDHMATTSAFSDLLGTEPSVSVDHFEPAPRHAAQESSAIPVTVRSTIPDYELPVSWREQEGRGDEVPAPAAAEPTPVQPAIKPEREPIPTAPAIAARPLQIPVYQEPEAGDAYAFLPTSTPAPAEIEIPREPELLETAADATRNTLAEDTEPGLLSTGQQFESIPADAMAAELAPVEEPFTPAGFQDIPADIASHLPPVAVQAAPVTPPEKVEPTVEPFSDADFEARVAAALAAYSRAQEAPPVVSEPPVSDFPPADVEALPPPDIGRSAESAEAYIHQTSRPVRAIGTEYEPAVSAAAELPQAQSQPEEATSVTTTPALPDVLLPEDEPVIAAAQPPVFEYHPPVNTTHEAPAPEAVGTLHAAQPRSSEPSVAEAGATSDDHRSLAASVETLPQKAAAAAAGADHHTISQAVHRVMERLKPELVEEILRELKSKKD